MARPKRITAAPLAESTEELLARLQAVVKSAGITDEAGKPLEDFDPLEQLAIIGMTGGIDKKLRIECLKEVASYLRPKQRAIEVSGNAAKPIEVQVTVFKE